MAPVRGMRNMLMELRKICQHPYLSQPDLEDLTQPDDKQREQLINASGKLYFLKILLPKLKARGHRVLLFSQFKIALDRIEDFLQLEGFKFRRIDGDTPQAQRQMDIDAYNAPGSDVFVFLLTTRAGGVGINLATANTVIMYDPDFNPHMDLQAIARAHRFGQQKKVLVFKLMVKQSVEEKILQAGKKKMVLDHLVVQNMGKEEDVDVDSMLLHGARALLEDNNQNDIVYTAENVEELIDRVEADAESQVVTEGEPQAKEAMAFDFAKVWEVGKGAAELVEQEGEAEEESHEFWANVTRNAEAARKKQEADRNSRRAKMKAPVYYAPISPTVKKKQSKGKEVVSDEDGDFQPGQLESEDEEIPDVMPDELKDLLAKEGAKVPAKVKAAPPKFLPFNAKDPAQQVLLDRSHKEIEGLYRQLKEFDLPQVMTLFGYAGQSDLAADFRKTACETLVASAGRVLVAHGKTLDQAAVKQAFDFLVLRGMGFEMKVKGKGDKAGAETGIKADKAADRAAAKEEKRKARAVAKEEKRKAKEKKTAEDTKRRQEQVQRQMDNFRRAQAQQAQAQSMLQHQADLSREHLRLEHEKDRQRQAEFEAQAWARREQQVQEQNRQAREAQHEQRIQEQAREKARRAQAEAQAKAQREAAARETERQTSAQAGPSSVLAPQPSTSGLSFAPANRKVVQPELCDSCNRMHIPGLCTDDEELQRLYEIRRHILVSDESDEEKMQALKQIARMLKERGVVVPPRPAPEKAETVKCSICAAPSHQPPQCPFVTAGSAVIATQLDQGAVPAAQIKPYQSVLKRVVSYEQSIAKDETPKHPYGRCWFCDEECGSESVRSCVESRGGRPSLKKRIRQLDVFLAQPGVADDDGFMTRARGILMNVYKQWPRQ